MHIDTLSHTHAKTQIPTSHMYTDTPPHTNTQTFYLIQTQRPPHFTCTQTPTAIHTCAHMHTSPYLTHVCTQTLHHLTHIQIHHFIFAHTPHLTYLHKHPTSHIYKHLPLHLYTDTPSHTHRYSTSQKLSSLTHVPCAASYTQISQLSCRDT